MKNNFAYMKIPLRFLLLGVALILLICAAAFQNATPDEQLAAATASVTPKISYFTVTPTTLEAGGTATVSWKVDNVASCTVIGPQTITGTGLGSQSIGPISETGTYSLTCDTTEGNVVYLSKRTITVTDTPSTLPPVSCKLIATPTNVTAGESVELTWSSTNATSLSLLTTTAATNFTSNGVGERLTAEGSKNVALTETTRYALYAIGPSGFKACGTSIDVKATTPPPSSGSAPNPASCVLDGVTVPHGSTSIFYRAKTAPLNATCSSISQRRFCDNGALYGSASYKYATCIDPWSPAVPTEAGYDILIVAGQSNAVGVGINVPGDLTQINRDMDSRIFQVSRATPWEIVPGKETLQHWSYSPQGNRTGFGMNFARNYARDLPTHRKVLIVPVARSGSSILNWLNIIGVKDTDGSSIDLYGDMKNRITWALQRPGKNRIAGFVWLQGETDILWAASGNPAMKDATDYVSKFKTLVTKLKSDFPAYGNFPIITAGFSPEWNTASNGIEDANVVTTKNNFMTALSGLGTTITNYGYVSPSGLTSNYTEIPSSFSGPGTSSYHSGIIHYSTKAQLELGNRYYTEYKRIKQSAQ